MKKTKDKLSHTFKSSGRHKHGFTDPRFIKLPGKTQAEINAGVLERALKAKPNLKVCTNHTKAVQPTVSYTVEQLRELKANRATGTKRFKTAI